jgi:hypothetical protein
LSVRTKERLDGLIAELTANCGDVFEACRSQGVSPLFVAAWRKDDKEVDEQITEAERCGRMGLVTHAIKRATVGVEKGVWYQGEQVGSETQYSDALLQTLLKTLPEFRDPEAAAKNVFNGPTQINLMPRAKNYDEWLAMKDSTINRKQLPAPVESVIDAEFTSVQDAEHEQSLEFLASIMGPPSPQLAGFDL